MPVLFASSASACRLAELSPQDVCFRLGPDFDAGAAVKDGKPPDETATSLHGVALALAILPFPLLRFQSTVGRKDNANYFCEYAYLYHQMDMLEDWGLAARKLRNSYGSRNGLRVHGLCRIPIAQDLISML